MRKVVYPKSLYSLFVLLIAGGWALTLIPQAAVWGWGLLLMAIFQSLGFVCIYVAELENDLMAQGKLAVGDWNPLITGLSCYRLQFEPHSPEATQAHAVQVLNRRFWREFLRTRRLLLRSFASAEQQQAALAHCDQLGHNWLQRWQEQLSRGEVRLREQDQSELQALLALQHLPAEASTEPQRFIS